MGAGLDVPWAPPEQFSNDSIHMGHAWPLTKALLTHKVKDFVETKIAAYIEYIKNPFPSRAHFAFSRHESYMINSMLLVVSK